jgi:hypothetical protein
MTDELIKRTLDEEFVTLTEVERDPVAAWMTIVDNAIRIEELEREQIRLHTQCDGLMQAGMNNGQALILAEAKLAKAMDALRIYAKISMIGGLAREVLADMEGK